jgi:Fe-S cluster assembly iron-binding protein IscA
MNKTIFFDNNIIFKFLIEGCGGFVYKFNFDKELNEDDFVYNDKNDERILFAVDEVTMKFVKGSVIDFEIDMMRQSFFVNK